MRLKIKANPKLKCLSLEMLQEVVANLTVEMDCSVRHVMVQPLPPADTTVLWQQTDTCGGNHIGGIKTFRNGAWT